MSAKEPHKLPVNTWPWKGLGGSLGRPVRPPMGLGLKALLQAVVMSSVAALIYWRLPHHRAPAYGLWSLSAVLVICGLFVPPAARAINQFLFGTLPHAIGAALNWLILTPFFFLVFAPAHLVLALTGRDPMTREFPSKDKTFWVPRKPVPDLGQYKKQH